MQRIIKFRAWKKANKNFIYSDNFNFDSLFWMEAELSSCVPEFIQQFTGLLDKNGKEIYEGDILDRVALYGGGKEQAVVTFENGEFVGMEIKDQESCTGVQYFLTCGHPYAVIGNIYETPELLEEVKI